MSKSSFNAVAHLAEGGALNISVSGVWANTRQDRYKLACTTRLEIAKSASKIVVIINPREELSFSDDCDESSILDALRSYTNLRVENAMRFAKVSEAVA